MTDSIIKIQKEIDKLYEKYYTIHSRNRAAQIKILHKIAGLKYKILKLKE